MKVLNWISIYILFNFSIFKITLFKFKPSNSINDFKIAIKAS